MTLASNPRYQGYCLRCCIYLLPDIQVSRNYKTKENAVAAIIKEAFTEYTWSCDKRIAEGCSRRRPDMILDLGSHIIIMEVDENKHDTGYDCENRRMMELSLDVGHRPIVLIRFNPDAYTNTETGVPTTSCWSMNKSGVLLVPKKKEKEWKERTDTLISQIRLWIGHEVNETTKTIEIVQLFY